MQPISLITANVVNKAAEIARTRPEVWKDPSANADICDFWMRKLLCNIAHDAAMPQVLRALAAIDVPADRAEFIRRVDAAADGLRKEDAQSTTTEAAP